MNFCLSYFLCMVSLQIGVLVLTGMYAMLTLAIIMVNGSEIISNFSSIVLAYIITFSYYFDLKFFFVSPANDCVMIGVTFLVFFTWLVASFGAYMNKTSLIKLAFIFWTIFIKAWIALSALRIIYGDKTFCVGDRVRCAPSMWLIDNGKSKIFSEPLDIFSDHLSEDISDPGKMWHFDEKNAKLNGSLKTVTHHNCQQTDYTNMLTDKVDILNHVIVAVYFPLFLYSWYVLMSYFVELKYIEDCIIHQHAQTEV